MKFSEITQLLGNNRKVEQVRNRYNNHLDPRLAPLKNAPWTDHEKQILYDAQKTLGNKWVTIAKLLPGRSENDVKNQWYNAKNRSRRAMRKALIKKLDGTEETSESESG